MDIVEDPLIAGNARYEINLHEAIQTAGSRYTPGGFFIKCIFQIDKMIKFLYNFGIYGTYYLIILS